MASSPKFTFPRETLTPIDGAPTNTMLQLLQQQLFTSNTHSLPSSRGGGLASRPSCSAPQPRQLPPRLRVGVPFILVPVHPGDPPPLPIGTVAVIGVALVHNYTEALADVALYTYLSSALTAQILSTVNASFLSALEDPDFGFGNVSPRTMLEHLRTEYDTLTHKELERNRAALSEPWNFDVPIETYGPKLSTSNAVPPHSALSRFLSSPPSLSLWR